MSETTSRVSLDPSGAQGGTEEGRVYAVGNDLPRRREIARHRVPRGVADRNRGGVAIQHPLERLAQDAKTDRAREPGVKGGHDGNADAPGCAWSNDTEGGIQAAVHVNDIETFLAKQRLEPRRKPPADGDPRHAAIRIDHETRADAP